MLAKTMLRTSVGFLVLYVALGIYYQRVGYPDRAEIFLYSGLAWIVAILIWWRNARDEESM